MASRKSSRLIGRTTYHHGDSSRALREGVVGLIREVGLEGVSLRELARRVGVNHAAVYRHFEDKEALFAAVARDGWTDLVSAMRAAALAAASAPPEARLSRMGAAYAKYALAHPDHYRVMTGPRLNESGRFPELEEPIQQAFSLLQTEIERGRTLGAFRDGSVQDWALRVWMFVHGYVTLVLARRVQVKPSRIEDYFEHMLLPLLARREDARSA